MTVVGANGTKRDPSGAVSPVDPAAATGALLRWRGRGMLELHLQGKTVDENLNLPLERLSEALQKAIGESEEVDEALRRLREEGFSAVLLLEVTVGLTRPGKDDGPEAADDETANATLPAKVNAGDVEFLRSLRIRLEE